MGGQGHKTPIHALVHPTHTHTHRQSQRQHQKCAISHGRSDGRTKPLIELLSSVRYGNNKMRRSLDDRPVFNRCSSQASSFGIAYNYILYNCIRLKPSSVTFIKHHTLWFHDIITWCHHNWFHQSVQPFVLRSVRLSPSLHLSLHLLVFHSVSFSVSLPLCQQPVRRWKDL